MNKKNAQWLIRSNEGKIQGPISTREVMLLINNGEFDGTESISSYPGGSWRPISHNSEFYDFLLTSLSKVESLDDDETNWDIDLNTTKKVDAVKKETPKLPDTPKDVPQIKKRKKLINTKESPEISKPIKSTSKIIDKSDEYDFSKEKVKKEEIKTVKKELAVKKKVKNNKSDSLLRKILILAVGLIGAYLFLGQGTNKSTGDITFLYPTKKIDLKPEDVKKEADQAVKYFLTDTFDGYVKAQKKFVKVLEADPAYEDLYSLLCISYYNLWSYSDKNIENLKVVTKLTGLAKKYDTTTLNYENCNNVYLILSGDKVKAEKNIDTIITKYGESNFPPTISYYLKSEILVSQQKFNESLDYVSMLEGLWQGWLATPYLSAVTYFNLNQKDQAIERFKSIIEKNPKNKKALIYVGAMRNVFFSQYEKSISEINKALKLKERVDNKVLSTAYYYLADSYLRLKKIDTAMPYIEKSYKYDPLNKKAENLYVSYFGGADKVKLSDQSYIAQGDEFFAQGDYNAAQAYYKEAIRANPSSDIAALKAAKSLWELKLSDDAISILKKSLEINPESVNVAAELANYLTARFKFNEAFDVLNKTHKKVRGHHKIYGSFANLELVKGNPIKAIKYADKALSKYEEDIESHIVKAKALLKVGENKKAYAAISKSLKVEPDNIELNSLFARAYYEVHGIDSGVRYINKLIKKFETVKEYRLTLGDIYSKDQQYSAAISVYKQLIEIDSKYFPAYMGLAKSYKNIGDLNESKKIYFKAAQLEPLESSPLLEVSLIYLETKNYRLALKQFERIKNVNPNFPKINYYFAKLNYLKGSLAEAIKWINKEKSINPSQLDAYLLAGEIYEKQGSYQFCAKEYQQAMKFGSFGAEVYVQISRCYRKSGALDVAVSMLEKARKLNSSVPDVYRELGAVYELKSEPSKARWAYENYLSLSPNAVDAAQVQQKLQSF